ncbi:microtubule-associated protein futsch, partial [Aplysia californica]|uniref:Microtubule-associated protein futsch n=1 Tax=Aplysia californica TaxID=6500 RepID=A0ABM1A5Q2_APLCA
MTGLNPATPPDSAEGQERKTAQTFHEKVGSLRDMVERVREEKRKKKAERKINNCAPTNDAPESENEAAKDSAQAKQNIPDSCQSVEKEKTETNDGDVNEENNAENIQRGSAFTEKASSKSEDVANAFNCLSEKDTNLTVPMTDHHEKTDDDLEQTRNNFREKSNVIEQNICKDKENVNDIERDFHGYHERCGDKKLEMAEVSPTNPSDKAISRPGVTGPTGEDSDQPSTDTLGNHPFSVTSNRTAASLPVGPTDVIGQPDASVLKRHVPDTSGQKTSIYGEAADQVSTGHVHTSTSRDVTQSQLPAGERGQLSPLDSGLPSNVARVCHVSMAQNKEAPIPDEVNITDCRGASSTATIPHNPDTRNTYATECVSTIAPGPLNPDTSINRENESLKRTRVDSVPTLSSPKHGVTRNIYEKEKSSPDGKKIKAELAKCNKVLKKCNEELAKCNEKLTGQSAKYNKKLTEQNNKSESMVPTEPSSGAQNSVVVKSEISKGLEDGEAELYPEKTNSGDPRAQAANCSALSSGLNHNVFVSEVNQESNSAGCFSLSGGADSTPTEAQRRAEGDSEDEEKPNLITETKESESTSSCKGRKKWKRTQYSKRDQNILKSYFITTP